MENINNVNKKYYNIPFTAASAFATVLFKRKASGLSGLLIECNG
jgi:hypothetical protein